MNTLTVQYLSDLHSEFERFNVTDIGADVLILAGDIHVGLHAARWIKQISLDIPIIYVLGNHEYYHNSFPSLEDELKASIRPAGIHLLEKEELNIGGVTFLGCSLWTDFKLFDDPIAGMESASNQLNDFHYIYNEIQKRMLTPEDTVAIFKESTIWLENRLENLRGERTVVITHHAPSENSISEQYKKSTLSSAFASNLEWMMQKYQPSYWVHGHVHHRVNYKVGKTRVIANPRGYPNENTTEFDPFATFNI